MEITKETIEKRKEQLQAEYQQTIATAQALGGAIQDCDYWLAQLAKETDKPAEE